MPRNFFNAILRPRLAALALGCCAAAFLVPTAAGQDAYRPYEGRRTNSITPTTQSVHNPADAILDRLLDRPPTADDAAPQSRPATQTQPQPEARRPDVAPDVGARRLLREGTFVIDRVGSVRRTDDGALLFTFASDGVGPAAAGDPPMTLVPNLNLMAIESAIRSGTDRRFRVTGRVTEYRGTNHLILEKVIVLN